MFNEESPPVKDIRKLTRPIEKKFRRSVFNDKNNEPFKNKLQHLIGRRIHHDKKDYLGMSSFTNLDVVEILQVTRPGLNDWFILPFFYSLLSEEKQKEIDDDYTEDLKEEYGLLPSHEQGGLDKHFREKDSDYRGGFVLRKSDPPYLAEMLSRILEPESYKRVLFSRLHPLFSENELNTLENSTVVFFGSSTGLEIAMHLAQLGVQKMIIIDPDVISSSNKNRIPGVTDKDRGKSKVQFAAELLTGLNAYIDLKLYPRKLTEEEIIEVLSQADLVVEMSDDASLKSRIPQLAEQLFREGKTKNGKPLHVIAENNVQWMPSINDYSPESDGFYKHLTPEERGILEGKFPKGTTREQKTYMKVGLVRKIIGAQNLPPRQMANLILYAKGELNYLAQHGPNAALGGASATLMAFNILCGYEQSDSVVIDMNKICKVDPLAQQEADRQLLIELAYKYERVFEKGFINLVEAIDYWCKEMWGEENGYTWDYSN